MRETECLHAHRLGLRPIAARTLSMFSGVRAVLTLPPGFVCLLQKLWFVTFRPNSCVAMRNLSMSLSAKMQSEYSALLSQSRYF